MNKANSRRKGLGCTVLVSLLCLAVVILSIGNCFDERRLNRIRAGMTASEVKEILGPATHIEPEGSRLGTPMVHCRGEQYTSVYIYERSWRDSLFVYLDSSQSDVLCVERHGYIIFN